MNNAKYRELADRAGFYHESAEYARRNGNMNGYFNWKNLERQCIAEYERLNSYSTK